MLDKRIVRNQLLELAHADVVVVDVAGLAGARRARRVRDGGCEEGGVVLQQARVEGSFADA